MRQKNWEVEPSLDWMHWSAGVKVEIPRHTKHNFHRYIIKLRLLCFGVAFKRLNDGRVPKPSKQHYSGAPDA